MNSSDNHQSQEFIKKMVNEWHLAFDGIPFGIIVCTNNGSIYHCNPAAVEMLRLKDKDVIRKQVWEMLGSLTDTSGQKELMILSEQKDKEYAEVMIIGSWCHVHIRNIVCSF